MLRFIEKAKTDGWGYFSTGLLRMGTTFARESSGASKFRPPQICTPESFRTPTHLGSVIGNCQEFPNKMAARAELSRLAKKEAYLTDLLRTLPIGSMKARFLFSLRAEARALICERRRVENLDQPSTAARADVGGAS